MQRENVETVAADLTAQPGKRRHVRAQRVQERDVIYANHHLGMPRGRDDDREILPQILRPDPQRAREPVPERIRERRADLDLALRHDDAGFAALAQDVHRQDARAGLLKHPASLQVLLHRPHIVRRDGSVATDGHFPGGREKADVHVVRAVAC